MSYFRFPENQCLFDVTPVENLFIEEYMRMAPGDFVKVYLYGLMHCYYSQLHVDMPSFARALSMEEAVVGSALKYWERRGLVRPDGEGFAFLNAKSVIYSDRQSEDALYRYKDYTKNIQDIFEGRTLMPDELQTAIDWLEVYGFEAAAAIYMLVYCVEKKYSRRKTHISFAQLNKTAVEWAEKGLLTLDAAEDFVAQEELRRSDIRKVMKSMGVTRLPTDAERELFQKWTRDWALSTEVILSACAEMTRISNPNFAYLDRVVEGYHSQGLNSPEEIERHRENHGGKKPSGASRADTLVKQVDFVKIPSHEYTYIEPDSLDE